MLSVARPLLLNVKSNLKRHIHQKLYWAMNSRNLPATSVSQYEYTQFFSKFLLISNLFEWFLSILHFLHSSLLRYLWICKSVLQYSVLWTTNFHSKISYLHIVYGSRCAVFWILFCKLREFLFLLFYCKIFMWHNSLLLMLIILMFCVCFII